MQEGNQLTTIRSNPKSRELLKYGSGAYVFAIIAVWPKAADQMLPESPFPDCKLEIAGETAASRKNLAYVESQKILHQEAMPASCREFQIKSSTIINS